MTYLELLTDALRELNILDAEQEAQAADADLALRTLNRMFDAWNADGHAAYVVQNADFTLTPSLNPHTIGPSGTLSAARPVAIEQAVIVSGSIVYPVTLRDLVWWNRLTDPTLTGEIPTDLNYRATATNGSIYLWPVPSAANTLRLALRTSFAEVTADTVFTLPAGYQDAVMLTLAERLARPFGAQVSADLKMDAAAARARAFQLNDRPVRISTVDAGMPSHGGGRYDYRTGMIG